ncbi:carbon-nitrogen hydrolase family protein [Nocardia sp. NPDC051030]|uniref:carbon-nitrogen hydrolase family protein n=1 Tax=Nocardia sp. NPDC051030 TaxID=3155162 RepID=UPI0034132F0F
MRSPLIIAAAQLACVPGDIDANVVLHVDLIDKAAESGARAVVFTELSLIGYELDVIAQRLPELATGPNDPRLQPLRAACARHGIHAVVGAVLPAETGYTISSLVFDGSGDLAATYAKQHLHGVEGEIFCPGTDCVVIEVDGWKLGLAICADVNLPEHAAETVAAGADVYVASALYMAGKEARRDGHMVARATENNCWTVLSAYSARVDGEATTGGSGIWRPDGSLAAQSGPESPALAIAALTEA